MAWIMRVGNRELSFGASMSGLGLISTPQVQPIVDREWYRNARRDGRRAGPGYRVGQVVSLSVEARPDHRPLDEVWRELLSVWRADEVRDIPGALASLTSDSGRTAYGWPADFDPDQEYRLFDTDRAVLGFECIDDLWYGPAAETMLGFTPTYTGGLPVPANVPFVLGGGAGTTDQIIQVAGDATTWAVYTLHGPIVDPWIDVLGVGRLILRGEVPEDRPLVIDTRTWARSVKLDGAALPGALSPQGARLSDMCLKPGAYQIIFGGYDPTGRSRLTVRHEPAYTSF